MPSRVKAFSLRMIASILLLLVSSVSLFAQMNKKGLVLELKPGASYSFSGKLGLQNITISPHLAAWAETTSGEFISTIHVSLKNGKQDFWVGNRPHPLPVWKSRIGKEKFTDANSGASPLPAKVEQLSYPLNFSKSTNSEIVVWVEVNSGFDFNTAWTEKKAGVWGQPSLLYKAKISTQQQNQITSLSLAPWGRAEGNKGALVEDISGFTTALSIFSEVKLNWY